MSPDQETWLRGEWDKKIQAAKDANALRLLFEGYRIQFGEKHGSDPLHR